MSEKNPKLLQALPEQEHTYWNTHFSISSGYQWGKGMSEEKTSQFFQEIKSLFTKAGWSVKEAELRSSCPTVGKGGSALYCHPMELSGPCERSLYLEVIKILNQAKTCTYRDVFTYDQIYDMTEEQYEEALKSVREDIEIDLMDAFSTDRKSLYHTGYYSNVERAADRYRILTLDRHLGICSDDVHMKYVTAVFQDLVKEGKILKREHPDRGAMYRSATGPELLELARRQAANLNSRIQSAQNRSHTQPPQDPAQSTQNKPSRGME